LSARTGVADLDGGALAEAPADATGVFLPVAGVAAAADGAEVARGTGAWLAEGAGCAAGVDGIAFLRGSWGSVEVAE
jgi:hypothetical protein